METRVIIAVVLSVAVMYGYSFIFPPEKQVARTGTFTSVSSSKPVAPVAESKPVVPVAPPVETAVKDVVVETDFYTAVFTSRGGSLKKLVLKKYHEHAGPGSSPVVLVNAESPEALTLVTEGKGYPLDGSINCSVSGSSFSIAKGEKRQVEFSCAAPQGYQLRKIYTFYGDGYGIDLQQQLLNSGSSGQSGSLGLVLASRVGDAAKENRFEENGAVTLSDNEVVQVTHKDLEKGIKQYDKAVLWSGYADKYFLSAVVGASQGAIGSATVSTPKGQVRNSILSVPATLNPGDSRTVSYKIYFGPKDLDILKAAGNRLDEVVDLGWFSSLAKPLLTSLRFFYKYVHNYGIAIIIITVIIKVLFYPLTYKSYKSMKGMQKIQPKMQELKEKYKNDRDAMNKAVMELYQTHKVNPLGGCLPMLVQMPIFIALYRALMSSIELRHAPFMLWIQDLSTKDPYYVTPILMGGTMFIQQKMTPTTGMDPTQAKIMLFLPVIFTVMFINMPSGLVLYWLVNNILTIAQQMYINKLLKE